MDRSRVGRPRRHARTIVTTVTTVLLALVLLLTGSASALAPTGEPDRARPDAPADASVDQPAGTSPAGHRPVRSDDEVTHVRARIGSAAARFEITGYARTTYRATVDGDGTLRPRLRRAEVRTGAAGRATLVVPLERRDGVAGGVVLTLRSRDGRTVRSLIVSRWERVTADGRRVQADSRIAARGAAIRADHPAGPERRAAFRALHRAPAGTVTVSRSTPTSLAGDEVEVRGRVTWTDFRGAELPARHVAVDVTDLTGLFGPQLIDRLYTDDDGWYSVTFTPSFDTLDQVDVQVEVVAENPTSARVYSPFDGRTYSQITGDDDVPVGSSTRIDYQAPADTEFGQAFAIHDALWTAQLFAGVAGGGDEDQVPVMFPFGNDDHAAVSGNVMVVGAFEWSSWDVLNHEYGHWFDHEHDITDSPGGGHCVDANLASNNCGDDHYSKDEGTRLAYGEGFASYYSESAAHYAAVPAGLSDELADGTDVEVGNYTYDDVITDHDGEASLSVDFEVDGSGGHGGEDNEAVTAGLLFRMQGSATGDSSPVDEHLALGPAYTMSLLEDSDARRLSDFLQYVWADDGTHRLTGLTPERDLGCLLEDADLAPDLYSASATVTEPPDLDWNAGNRDDFENDRFVVQAFDPGSVLPYFTSDPIGSTSWTPTGREWSRVTAGRGTEVLLRVTGWQDGDPATGPFRGCLTPVSLGDSPVVNKAGCQDVTLPANDDGSTGAVPLPFAVDFFGTTYTDLFVNNNGNVTFDNPLSTYTPFTLDASTPPIIAPFFADIDTRGSGSAEATYSYGATTWNGRPAFCVNWLNVGYYSAHWDKLNSAQLLLVDRSDQGVGDFDIVFNYGGIQWETGDASGGSGGMGGTPAAVGYSAGNNNADGFFQLPGSLETGAFLDDGPHALADAFNTTARTPGRLVFPVRNGSAGNSATGVVGTVSSAGFPVEGAIVQVCPAAGGQCVFQTRTGVDGSYAAVGLVPGEYTVKAYPPSGLSARPRTADATVEDRTRTRVDLDLAGIDGAPPGTTIGPLVGSGSLPTVNWHDALTLRTTGCVGAYATYEILGLEGPTLAQTLASGQMTEGEDGVYTASVPPLYPAHGAASVSILLQCPGAADQEITFDIYIDPSGEVVDTDGDPVAGATVTLESAPTPDGPFTAVPDGSAVMSPANRANPMTTNEEGHYGWDVVAGYYRVRAAKDGCTAPDGGPEVVSDVLTIPPPVTDLVLVLDCPNGDTAPPVITAPDTTLEGNATGGFSGAVPGVSAHDEGTPDADVELTSDAPALLPLGTTAVTWTARDPAGNEATVVQQVTVVDTTRPAITCPADVAAPYTADPALGTATSTDVVDASPAVGDARPATWPLGRTDVTWTARDASGNAATCVQAVVLSVPATSSVSAGDGHSLAVLADGRVQAWGAGAVGQLGRGTTASSKVPVTVPGLTDVRVVRAGGLFSLALRADGSVWAWGDNTQGQLGDGTTTRRLAPVRVTGLPPVRAIAAGQLHALAVGLDGSVWAWGDNTHGQLGSTPSLRVLRPARVPGLTGATDVAAGLHHSVALTATGEVWTWGGGYAGQRGDGTTVARQPVPARVAGLPAIGSVAAGALHTLAVARDGATYSWGDNTAGQLGDGTLTRRPSPVRVAGLGPAVRPAGGAASSYVVLRDGTAWAFGNNTLGQLGDGTTSTRRTPVRVAGVSGVAALGAGATHLVVGLVGGTAVAAGTNLFGELGDGTTTARRTPVAVSGLTGLMPTTP